LTALTDRLVNRPGSHLPVDLDGAAAAGSLADVAIITGGWIVLDLANRFCQVLEEIHHCVYNLSLVPVFVGLILFPGKQNEDNKEAAICQGKAGSGAGLLKWYNFGGFLRT
jgi:hypothetical protein